jgi:hypothetical protein
MGRANIQLSFSQSRIICLLVFASMLAQQYIFDSASFPQLVGYIRRMQETALTRQAVCGPARGSLRLVSRGTHVRSTPCLGRRTANASGRRNK